MRAQRAAERMTDKNVCLSYEDRVAQMRKRFVFSVDARLDAIFEDCSANPVATGESKVRRTHRLLHDMAGNAAMLELDELAAQTRFAVEIAALADKATRNVTPDEKRQIEAIIATTRVIVARLKEQF